VITISGLRTFGARAISCSPREAIYVLDGLLENDTILRPREHYTDTTASRSSCSASATCSAIRSCLGSRTFRISSLPDRQGELIRDPGAVFRGTIDTALLREQDQLCASGLSLRSRTAPAHVVLERLAASSPSDRLAKALSMLGRVVKTIYILRYAHDAALRGRVQLQLNRGESHHALARRVFFANQGAFRVGDCEEIMNKVSALALLSNAVLLWNTVRIGEIVASLEGSSGQLVRREDLARVSPLPNAHVIPSGTYHFQRTARGESLP
jgi:TnpA family transposase